MKKPLMLIASLFMLAGCGNQNLWGTYTFNGIHVQFPNEEASHFELESWTNSENGIEVKIKGGPSMFCSEGTYALYEGTKCPICKE